jgi:TPR repeat protein
MRSILIPVLLLAGCASVPLEMRGYWQPQDALQWEYSRMAGIGLEYEDGSTHRLDSQVIENLISVHERLLKASGRRWLDLGIADTRAEGEPVFDAFMTNRSGGASIAVSLGLLDVIGRDPDALAAVLGHEMAHVALGHSPDQLSAREESLRRSQEVGAGLTTGSAAIAALIFRVGALAHYRSLTRDEERAADERGLQWAVKAGFDPCGMTRALAASRARWTAEVPFFSTHPGSDERHALANRYSREAKGRDCPEPVTAAVAPASASVPTVATADSVAQTDVRQGSEAQRRFEAAMAAFRAGEFVAAMPEVRALADAGHAPAQAELGYCYLVGRAGLPVDEAEGARWIRLAAEQGHAWAQSMLGRMYVNGRGGIAKDEHEALRLFGLSAAQGHPYGQLNLGLAYETGLAGLDKDRLQAAKHFQRAADMGDAAAQARLGWVYLNGTVGIQNHPGGQVALASMYYFGAGGLARDRVEAQRLTRLAAEQGNVTAQTNLGEMYENGEGGLSKDVELAVQWYRRAAAQGHARAIGNLKRLGRE